MDILKQHRDFLKDYEGLMYGIGIEGHYKQGMEWTKTKYKDAFWSPEINLIGERKDRLKIEFDDDKAKENLEKVRETLIQNKWKFIRTTHHGKCDYLWVEFTRNLTSKEKESFLKWIAPPDSKVDLNFASYKKVFPVMYAQHWKHSYFREMPIEVYAGEKIDIEKICKPNSNENENGFVYKTYTKPSESSSEPKPSISEETLALAQVELGKCYEQIIDVLKYYIDMPEENYKFLAVWIIGTYFHKDFNTFPILFFNAMRGSAKTRTSKLVNYLSKGGKGMVTNNTTESVLFRHPKGIIMSLDEIERIGQKEMGAIRELLNACYKKGTKIDRTKKVKTKEGEDFVVESFEPYFPLTIANIWGLEEVLQDRAFTIILEKSNNPLYTAIIEDWTERQEIQDLKFALSKISVVSDVTLRKKNYIRGWNDFIKSSLISSLTTLTTLTTQTTQTTLQRKETLEIMEKDKLFTKLYSSGITGRNLELSFPLLITARCICEETFDDILKIIKERVTAKKEEEYFGSTDVSLYSFIADYNKSSFDYTSMKTMIKDFREYLEQEEEWLNEKWLGKALARLNLILEKQRTNSGRKVRLNTAKAKEKLKMFKMTEKEDKDENTKETQNK